MPRRKGNPVRTVTSSRRRLALALVAVIGTTGAAHARAADSTAAPATAPTQQELLEKINALQSEVNQLKTQQAATSAEQKLESQRSVDASVAQVQADAQRHSQLFDLTDGNAVVAQHTDSGFKFHTADGNFSVNPWLQLQFRYETTYRSRASTGDDTQSGFEVRRLKYGADGNLFGPNLTYFLQFSVDRTSGNTLLELAWAKYHFQNTPFSVQFGDIKDPLDHEQIISSRYMNPIERTLVDDIFAHGEGFAKGVTVTYEDKALRAAGSFTGGLNNYNTNFEEYPANADNWGTAGRVEYKFFGDWKDYDTHFSAYGTQQDTLVAGISGDWSEAGKGGTFTHVLDAEYLAQSGLFLYGAYLGRYTRDDTVGTGKTATVNDTYDSTLRVQASYLIDTHWEPYVQYEYIHFDAKDLAAKSEDQVHVFRIGASYYFYGHSAKFQTDVSYLPNGSPTNDTNSGVLLDNGHNELIWRAQFQLLL